MPRSQPQASTSLAMFLIPTMGLVAVLPLILHGCSCGHDFDFHILSWFEAAAQFRAGNLHPAWAFSPAFNAGEPRFVFYPPISWTLGAMLGLAMRWTAVPIVYTWIALTAAGATMYRLARQFSGRNAALFTAAIYMANPYMLFTAYERTAYAELFAAAWLPMLLAAALRERISPVRIAIPVALLWLTNAPAAVMGCYALALIALVRVIGAWSGARHESPSTACKACATVACRFAAGAGLGLALAAFYIVPAVHERPWVQIAMATISGMRIGDNFLFHHTADPLHDEVLHTASMLSVALVCAAVAAFAVAFVRTRQRAGLVPLAVLSAAIGFMLTPLSAGAWRIAPEMAFLQFPWRLLAVLAPAVCVAIAVAIDRLPESRPAGTGRNKWSLSFVSLAVVVVFTLPAVSSFRQPCDDEDNVAARLALFNSKAGTDPTDEYTPTDADNDSLAHADPAFWLATDPDSKPSASSAPGPVPMHFTTNAPLDETLVLNLRNYPAWQVEINGEPAASVAGRADGLIAVPVHAGPVRVDVTYVTGRDYTLGEAISLAAMAVALGLGFIKPHRRVSS